MPTRSSTIDRAGSSCHFIETKGQKNRFSFAPSAAIGGSVRRLSVRSLISSLISVSQTGTGYQAPPPRIIMMSGGARSDGEPRALRSAFGGPIGEQNHFAWLLAYGLPPRWQRGEKPR
jgi:hypothetical protein